MRACFALVVGMSLRSSLADPEPVRFNLITYAGTPPSHRPYPVITPTQSSPLPSHHPYLVRFNRVTYAGGLRPQRSITLTLILT